MCLGVWVFGCLGVWVFGCLGVSVFRCSGVLVFRCFGVQVSRCLGVQVLRCSGLLTFFEGHNGDQGGGPKMANIQHGVKPDIFKITHCAKRTKSVKVHFASLMDMCHLKNSELEAKYQKCKGPVVLRGDIVKDDSGSYATFTGQGSSAPQMNSWISSPDCQVSMDKQRT